MDDNLSDTLIKDIPKKPDGSISNVYWFVMKMAAKLKVDNLENGFDPIQIRVWCSYPKSDTSQLFILKRLNNDWAAQLLTYFFKDNKMHPVMVDTSVIMRNNLTPKSGWESFINDLFELQVKKLPDMGALPGNSFDIFEANVFTVEIATKKKYRLYSYLDPYDFQDHWWQAKNMESILELIEKQFNFKRIK